MNNGFFLSVRQAAQELGLSVMVVRSMVDRGVLRSFRPYARAHIRIPREDVERIKNEFLRQGTQQSG